MAVEQREASLTPVDDDESSAATNGSETTHDDSERIEHPFTFEASGPITVRTQSGSIRRTHVEEMELTFQISSIELLKDLWSIQHKHHTHDRDNHKDVLELIEEWSDYDWSDYHVSADQLSEWNMEMGGSVESYRELTDVVDSYSGAKPTPEWHCTVDATKHFLFDRSAAVALVSFAHECDMMDDTVTQAAINNHLVDQ